MYRGGRASSAAPGPGGNAREGRHMVQKRVLIVEDEANMRTVLREVLERSGYVAAEAADGLEGLAKAESWHPHAVLLDIRMPDLDGYEVCRRLKANPTTKPIPVIVVTAVVDSPVSRLAYEAGAAACVLKPFRLEALVTVIQTTIAGAERRAKSIAKREGNPA